MDAYDKWKTSPPEPEKVGNCEHCSEDVYKGDPIYVVSGEPIHDSCFLDYAMIQLDAMKVN